MDKLSIVYECDREACGNMCSYPMCKHTTNIEHAKNFKKEHGYYTECSERGANMMNLQNQLKEAETRLHNLEQNMAATEDECAELHEKLEVEQRIDRIYREAELLGRQYTALFRGMVDGGLPINLAEEVIKAKAEADMHAAAHAAAQEA